MYLPFRIMLPTPFVSTSCLMLFVLLFAVQSAQAHFIWLLAEPADQPKKINVCFSEDAAPDDPELLKQISDVAVWQSQGEDPPQQITLAFDRGALNGDLPVSGSGHALFATKTYGVTAHGKVPGLLRYYAKAYPSQLPSSWQPVNQPELLPLEIHPKLNGDRLTLTVMWKGHPAVKSEVTVSGPGIKEKIQGDTDDQGQFTVQIPRAGLFSIRARREESMSGEHMGKKYDQIRDYATLALNVVPATILSVNDRWPPLTKGMTSFGSAVINDDLYVYGGHWGGAHAYAVADQSNELQRLNLRNPQQWEMLAPGPRLTGLAMVAYNGKLYRIGGFEVQGSDEAHLQSKADFARYDPATNTWEDLVPLPEPRSSHDAVMIGDQLYVVGGWTLNPEDGGEHKWLKTAWRCDLSQSKLEWKPLPEAPFQRRAISAGEWNGRLYVIGGMQPNSESTTRVDYFDPESNRWKTGPAILGSGLDGFGTASFSTGSELVTTTMSGTIQKLSGDGMRWEYVGQLQHPRFFHEMGLWNGDLIVVGGASMQSGKRKELERLPFSSAASLMK